VAGVSVIVHCAARVHVMKNVDLADPLTEFRKVNVDGTLRLARQAAKTGVRRFILVSSIGVNGGETFGRPYAAADEVAPHTPYAVSKYEAEVQLRSLADETGMEVVIIRPPLVYGPNAPGNFASLMKYLVSGLPLPLGSVTHNRRSLVFLDNLVDLIVTCVDHPAAANQTFLVSDDEDLSTVALLQRMAAALGTPARLIPVPLAALKLGARIVGRPELAQRLLGSLELDISKTKSMLGWSPPVKVDEALRITAENWLISNRSGVEPTA
jgi:nucleoside-diphosphate-sugar epimerase